MSQFFQSKEDLIIENRLAAGNIIQEKEKGTL